MARVFGDVCQPGFEEFNVDVNQLSLDTVKLEYFCDGLKGRPSESRVDTMFGSPGDEGLGQGDLIHEVGKD